MKYMKSILAITLLLASFSSKADFNAASDHYAQKNYQAAYEEFLNLAEMGEKRAQFNLGVMYYQGQHVEKNINKAYAWTKLAVESANSSEQEKNIHNIIASKLTEKQLAEAEYQSLANSYSSEVLIDRLYPVITKSYKKADFQAKPTNLGKKKTRPKYPRKALEKGIIGTVSLVFDIDKLGNPRNIRVRESFPEKLFEKHALKAITYWRFEASKNKAGEAIYTYDSYFTMEFRVGERDFGVPEKQYNEVKAAALAGDPQAQLTYGFWHEKLNNLPDDENSTEWFLKAATQGSSYAQYELGKSLLHGKGCQTDKVKGLEWLTRSASNGRSEAKELLAGLAAQGTTLESQKQALTYLDDIDNMSSTSIIRLSWLLIKSPYKEITDPKRAIKLLEKLNIHTFKDEVTKQEILAAAHASLGKYKKAVSYQEDALDDAENLGFDITEIKQHLALYKKNEKWF